MNVDSRKFRLHDARSGSAITVHITPRAAQNGVVDILNDGTIKLTLATVKVDKDLDRDLVAYLSELLEIPPSRIEVVAGSSGLNKLVTITGLKAVQVQKKILDSLRQNK
jgi:uncharacterized protein YggU (UPF0235/DUF167 family)